MRVRLDYGTDGLEVELPDERVTVIEPIARTAAADPKATLLDAIRAPLECAPLREIARAGQRVAISVCDITRAQPRVYMLRALFEEMPQVRPEDVTILIATGTHRINTPPELERMLGRDILNRYRVVNHDSRDPSSLGRAGMTSTGVEVFLKRASLAPAGTPAARPPAWRGGAGMTSTGVEVFLNRAWLDADVRITTGFVEPHFFAGFSGGPKMVAPGLAGWKQRASCTAAPPSRT